MFVRCAHVKSRCAGYGQEPSQCVNPRERHTPELFLRYARIGVLVCDDPKSDRVLLGGSLRTA